MVSFKVGQKNSNEQYDNYSLMYTFLKTHKNNFLNNKIKRASQVDHNVSSGIMNKLINLLTRFELYIISQNMKIIIGSSCIIVAKKPGNDSF